MRSPEVPSRDKPRQVPWWIGVLAGSLAIAVGVFLILSPGTTASYLFLVLGAACIAGAAVALISILFSRAGWGWRLLAAVVAAPLGLAFLSQPLFSAYLAAAITLWLLGVLFLVAGTVSLIVAFSGIGWWYGILGGLIMAVGALVLLGSTIGPLKVPWLFGLAFIVAGIAAFAAGIRASRPSSTPPSTPVVAGGA
jgi:uncharacterized membrane protein HdeD (DUF308 family)